MNLPSGWGKPNLLPEDSSGHLHWIILAFSRLIHSQNSKNFYMWKIQKNIHTFIIILSLNIVTKNNADHLKCVTNNPMTR